MAKPTIRKPELEEFAPSAPAVDPGALYSGKLLVSTDTVLRHAGGDLAIYRELLRDDQVKANFGQRRLALVSKGFQVLPGAENDAAAEEAAFHLDQQLRDVEWDRITDRMLYGLHYGYSIGECMWDTSKGDVRLADVRVRRRERFGFGVDRRLYLYTVANPGGELMPEKKFWTFSVGGDNDDSPFGVGLANALYWPVFFKRQDIRFWTKYIERVALPTMKGKVPAKMLDQAAEKAKILEYLRALNRDYEVAIPDFIEAELVEIARNSTVDFDRLRDTMDRAIAKVLIGQTMTSEQEGGQYKADVAKDVRDEIITSDAGVLANSFNAGPARWLTDWNFGPDVPCPRLKWMTEQEEDKRERAERDAKVFQLGYSPTEEYIKDTYGEGWVKRTGAPAGELGGPVPAPGNFAEVAALVDALGGPGLDQQRIKDAAAEAGRDFRAVIGDRVRQLLAYAEDAQDFQTLRRRLAEMAEEQPDEKTVERLQQNGFMARLLGGFRQQRD